MTDWPQKSAALYERIRHLPLADRVPPASLQQHLSAIVGGIFGVLKTIAVSFASVLTWLILVFSVGRQECLRLVYVDCGRRSAGTTGTELPAC